MTTPADDAPSLDEATALLAKCTEEGRLKRAAKLVDRVDFLLGEGELIIAAVEAKYNVVVDVAKRRQQRADMVRRAVDCRDFQGQAPSRHLCKHVAATVLALSPSQSLDISRELAEGAGAPAAGVVVPWRFEVIRRFTPGR